MLFSKSEKIKFSIMAGVLLLLLILFKHFVLSDRTQRMNRESSNLYFNFYQRDAEDVWLNVVPNHPLMHGTIYESKVVNRSSHNISNWKMVIKITKPVYLSNCWNGSIEIHQKTKGKTIIQPAVRLHDKEYDELKKLKVKKFCARKKPLLIYLNPGDKIIYYPDEEYSENIIPAYTGTDYHYTDIGFVFFKNDTEPMNMDFDFAKASLTYHMDDSISDNIMLYVFGVLFLMWLFIISSMIRLKIIKTAKLRDQEHDKQTIEQVMTVFTKFIDAKDIHTGGHSERVAMYSRMIAKISGRSEEFCQKVFYCGLLHDCGKISVGDTILSKTESLTEEELNIVRAHTHKGYELLKSLSSIPEACQTALYHHERFDGTGYPEHLSGKLIPEAARIVAIADSFDVMSTERYYRKGLPREKILEEFKDNSGTQFDPEFVNAFLKLVEENRI